MKTSSGFASACALTLFMSIGIIAGGCAHWPATPALEKAGTPGYRLAEVSRPGQSDDMLVVLAISGGGTRAAALGYGVLEELRRTEVMVNGEKRRLLDEGDAICGDLSKVTLGRAIATSTAQPPLLTPITLENRGGKCGSKAPSWQAAAEAAGRDSETPGRALLRARALMSYEDPKRPYIHPFDGGLSENLGLTEVLMAFELMKVDPDQAVLPSLRKARRVVVISVNALRFPEVDWDLSPAPPGKGTLADQMWSIPVDRISLDAVEKVHERLAGWESDAPGRHAYMAQVTFDALKDPNEKAYFTQLKTRLALPKEQVDKLREVGGRLPREAPGFQRLLADLKSDR